MTHRDEDEEIIDTALDTLAWQRREIDRLKGEVVRKGAALRLFLALIDDPDYDFGELCEEFVPIARAALGVDTV